MSVWKKAIIVSAAASLVAIVLFSLLMGGGYKYEPGISSTEMETLTHQEVVALMEERRVPQTAWEYYSTLIGEPYFWFLFLGEWLALATLIFISSMVLIRWHTNKNAT